MMADLPCAPCLRAQVNCERGLAPPCGRCKRAHRGVERCVKIPEDLAPVARPLVAEAAGGPKVAGESRPLNERIVDLVRQVTQWRKDHGMTPGTAHHRPGRAHAALERRVEALREMARLRAAREVRRRDEELRKAKHRRKENRMQILREKKKHPEMTPYSKCERVHALTGPRALENRIEIENISDDDGVPAVEPVVSEKRLIADAAAEPLGKRIKLSISPEANTEHPENSTSMAQTATRRAAAQELEPDSKTTSEAYNDAVGRARWIAFASEVLKEARNMDHSRLEGDESSVGDEEGKRWGEYFPSAQMAPHEPDDWTVDDDNDNNETDDHEGSFIGGLPGSGQSQKSSSLSDVVTVSTPYDMTDLQTPSLWGSEEVEPVEYESNGKGRTRYATLSPQALSPSQQLDSHTKALRHAGINLDCVKLLAANGSVDIQHFKSESTNEYGRPFAMPKAAEARRRGLEALLRCAAQQDE